MDNPQSSHARQEHEYAQTTEVMIAHLRYKVVLKLALQAMHIFSSSQMVCRVDIEPAIPGQSPTPWQCLEICRQDSADITPPANRNANE